MNIKKCNCNKTNHHYVQEAIQRKFKEDWKEDKQLYIITKKEREILPKNTLRNFRSLRLYSNEKLRYLKQGIIENHLENIDDIFQDMDKCIECNLANSLEKPYSELISRIVENVNNTTTFSLTTEGINLIKKYAYYQLLRTPSSKLIKQNAIKNSHHMNKDEIKKVIKTKIPLISEGQLNNLTALALKKIDKEHKKHSGDDSNWVKEALSKFHIAYLYNYMGLENMVIEIVYNRTGIPFVLCDKGLVLSEDKLNSLEGICLLIHPRIILNINKSRKLLSYIDDEDLVHDINCSIFDQSDVIASSDKDYLKKFNKKYKEVL